MKLLSRHPKTIAYFAATLILFELAGSLFALRHTHEHATADGSAQQAPECSHSCGSHRACTATATPPSRNDLPPSHQHDDDCTICRHMAQPVLTTTANVETVCEVLVATIETPEDSFVSAPAFLLPRPRAPPAV